MCHMKVDTVDAAWFSNDVRSRVEQGMGPLSCNNILPHNQQQQQQQQQQHTCLTTQSFSSLSQ